MTPLSRLEALVICQARRTAATSAQCRDWRLSWSLAALRDAVAALDEYDPPPPVAVSIQAVAARQTQLRQARHNRH